MNECWCWCCDGTCKSIHLEFTRKTPTLYYSDDIRIQSECCVFVYLVFFRHDEVWFGDCVSTFKWFLNAAQKRVKVSLNWTNSYSHTSRGHMAHTSRMIDCKTSKMMLISHLVAALTQMCVLVWGWKTIHFVVQVELKTQKPTDSLFWQHQAKHGKWTICNLSKRSSFSLCFVLCVQKYICWKRVGWKRIDTHMKYQMEKSLSLLTRISEKKHT